ncbi:uncharacterized protein LOC26535143 [Drosophila yakuba]|uniref:uncharacterized protein LOC26535143 n=1 Tax=Drosophila yakuba TaxID=7245 RepID=UPI001930819F|nr:uncharacterized protein LOC26535143 [Drosophila yakuba]
MLFKAFLFSGTVLRCAIEGESNSFPFAVTAYTSGANKNFSYKSRMMSKYTNYLIAQCCQNTHLVNSTVLPHHHKYDETSPCRRDGHQSWQLKHRRSVPVRWRDKNTTSAFPACRKRRLKGGKEERYMANASGRESDLASHPAHRSLTLTGSSGKQIVNVDQVGSAYQHQQRHS